MWGWRAVYAAAAAVNFAIVWALLAALPAQTRRYGASATPALVGSVFVLWREERVLRERGLLALLVFMAMTVLWTPMVLPLRAPPHALTHTEVGLFGLAGVLRRARRHAGRALGRSRLGAAHHRHRAAADAVVVGAVGAAAALAVGLIAGVLLIDFGLQAVHVSNQSLIYRVRPEAQSRLTAAYMVCYSIGCALGSIASTAVYDRAGWLGVCALGAGLNAIALLWWARTCGAWRAELPGSRPISSAPATSSSWRRD